MSLFKGSLRPPAMLSDEAIERYLAALRAEAAIDPLFRRRLRGQVVNRYVANREGTEARERPRHMGALGRAVLYASFSLAVSVTGVLAASQEALPGELLYSMKRQVETLRVQILPDRFHPELAAYALSERIGEMDRLADAGDWNGVARLATVIEQGHAELQAMDPAGADTALQQHFVVLHGLLDRLPEGARSAMKSNLDRVAEPHGGAPGNGSTDDGNGGRDRRNEREPSPRPARSPKPEATPRGDRSAATSKPDRSDEPRPTPRAGDLATLDPTPKAKKSPRPDGE